MKTARKSIARYFFGVTVACIGAMGNCSDAQNTMEMKECASADLQRADKALNATYKS